MELSIKPVTHESRRGGSTEKYCGPAAISSIAGCTAELAAAWLNHQRGRGHHFQARGVFHSDMRDVLAEFGLSLHRRDRHPRGSGPTLVRWIKERTDPGTLYLVNVTGHYVVAQGRILVDSHRKTPTFIHNFPGRRKRVVMAWAVAGEPRELDWPDANEPVVRGATMALSRLLRF